MTSFDVKRGEAYVKEFFKEMISQNIRCPHCSMHFEYETDSIPRERIEKRIKRLQESKTNLKDDINHFNESDVISIEILELEDLLEK